MQIGTITASPSRSLCYSSAYATTLLAAEVAAAVEESSGIDGPRIVAALQAAVAVPDIVAPRHLEPRADRYARHVIHADPLGRFTILSLVWSKGQASPIHAHHTWCAYAVRSGLMSETLFRLEGADRMPTPLRTSERHAGYGCFTPAGPELIHRLGNDADEVAHSIHVYGIGEARIATGVNRVFG